MTTATVLKRKASSARSSGASTPFEPTAAAVSQHVQPPVLTTISNSNASSPPVTSIGTGENRVGVVGNAGGNNHVGIPNNTSSTIQQAVYSKKARILEQQHHHFPAHHHHHHGINHGPYHGGVVGPGGTYNSSSSSSPDTPVASGTPTGPNWMMDQPLALKKEESRSPSPSTPSPPPDSPPPSRTGRRDDSRDEPYHHSMRMSRANSPTELLRRSTSSSPKPGWVGNRRDAPSPPPTSLPPAHSNMYQHHNQQPHHPLHHSHHHQTHPHNLRKLSGQSSLSRGGVVDDAFVDDDDDPEYEDLSRGANPERGRGSRDGPMINDADMNPSDEEEEEEEPGHHPQSRNSLDLASSSRSSSTSGINLIQGQSHMDQVIFCRIS